MKPRRKPFTEPVVLAVIFTGVSTHDADRLEEIDPRDIDQIGATMRDLLDNTRNYDDNALEEAKVRFVEKFGPQLDRASMRVIKRSYVGPSPFEPVPFVRIIVEISRPADTPHTPEMADAAR